MNSLENTFTGECLNYSELTFWPMYKLGLSMWSWWLCFYGTVMICHLIRIPINHHKCLFQSLSVTYDKNVFMIIVQQNNEYTNGPIKCCKHREFQKVWAALNLVKWSPPHLGLNKQSTCHMYAEHPQQEISTRLRCMKNYCRNAYKCKDWGLNIDGTVLLCLAVQCNDDSSHS